MATTAVVAAVTSVAVVAAANFLFSSPKRSLLNNRELSTAVPCFSHLVFKPVLLHIFFIRYGIYFPFAAIGKESHETIIAASARQNLS